MKITAIADRDVGQVWGATFEASAEDVLPVERVVAAAGFSLRASDNSPFFVLPFDSLLTTSTENSALLVSPRAFGVLDGVVVSLPNPGLTLSANSSGITIGGLVASPSNKVKGFYAKESDPTTPVPLPARDLSGTTYPTTELIKGATYRIVMMVKQIGAVVQSVKVT